MNSNSAERFSDRVQNYIRYRPGYPRAMTKYIQTTIERIYPGRSSLSVADIGSGTGIFTKYLLNLGLKVYAVEPNSNMRNAAGKILNDEENFISIPGTAENSGLTAFSVDLIFAAQAFHWFDIQKTRKEFKRILNNDNGQVFLVWNQRISKGNKFLEEYEHILTEHATDYSEVNHTNIGKKEIDRFYGNSEYFKIKFDNFQVFDKEGFLGRVFSSSYVPLKGKEHSAMKKKLNELFEEFNQNGNVKFLYDTVLYHGVIL